MKNAELRVELEGEVPKAWKQSFKKTVRLLGSGDWGEVSLKKRTISVGDVAPGNEDKLRHYIESLVEQANASIAPDEQSREDDAGPEPDGPDAEMTERFRGYAGEREEETGD